MKIIISILMLMALVSCGSNKSPEAPHVISGDLIGTWAMTENGTRNEITLDEDSIQSVTIDQNGTEFSRYVFPASVLYSGTIVYTDTNSNPVYIAYTDLTASSVKFNGVTYSR